MNSLSLEEKLKPVARFFVNLFICSIRIMVCISNLIPAASCCCGCPLSMQTMANIRELQRIEAIVAEHRGQGDMQYIHPTNIASSQMMAQLLLFCVCILIGSSTVFMQPSLYHITLVCFSPLLFSV